MDKIKKIKVLLGMVKAQFSEVKLADGTTFSYDAEELTVDVELYDGDGNPVADGEYTLDDDRVITVKDGKLVEIKEVAEEEVTETTTEEEMAEETPTEEPVAEEEQPAETEVVDDAKPIDDRVAELEAKVDEIYNLILQLTEKEREREERVEEVKQEFAALKSAPSAQPVFVQPVENESNMLAEKLRRIKNLK